MKNIYLLIFVLLVIACEGFNDPESPYVQEYVIFANISANKPMIDDTVFVSRTASLDESIDAEELWVSDAKIILTGGRLYATAYPVKGRPGRYQTDNTFIYYPGITYTLTVEVGGRTLTAKTNVPKSLEIASNTDLKNYICKDGLTLPIAEINIDNMDKIGEPIPDKVDTLLYNYGECFTGSFASYPMFMLDFKLDDASKIVRTLTYALDSDEMGLEPGTPSDFFDYNRNNKQDSTLINIIYDTTFANTIWKGKYQRDINNNPFRENPFVWSNEITPIRMSWLYFNYYGLQKITVQSTDNNFDKYFEGDPFGQNIYTLPGSNIEGGYGMFSSDISVSFYIYLKRGKDYSKDS
jgi:hypothetical protein